MGKPDNISGVGRLSAFFVLLLLVQAASAARVIGTYEAQDGKKYPIVEETYNDIATLLSTNRSIAPNWVLINKLKDHPKVAFFEVGSGAQEAVYGKKPEEYFKAGDGTRTAITFQNGTQNTPPGIQEAILHSGILAQYNLPGARMYQAPAGTVETWAAFVINSEQIRNSTTDSPIKREDTAIRHEFIHSLLNTDSGFYNATKQYWNSLPESYRNAASEALGKYVDTYTVGNLTPEARQETILSEFMAQWLDEGKFYGGTFGPGWSDFSSEINRTLQDGETSVLTQAELQRFSRLAALGEPASAYSKPKKPTPVTEGDRPSIYDRLTPEEKKKLQEEQDSQTNPTPEIPIPENPTQPNPNPQNPSEPNPKQPSASEKQMYDKEPELAKCQAAGSGSTILELLGNLGKLFSCQLKN